MLRVPPMLPLLLPGEVVSLTLEVELVGLEGTVWTPWIRKYLPFMIFLGTFFPCCLRAREVSQTMRGCLRPCSTGKKSLRAQMPTCKALESPPRFSILRRCAWQKMGMCCLHVLKEQRCPLKSRQVDPFKQQLWEALTRWSVPLQGSLVNSVGAPKSFAAFASEQQVLLLLPQTLSWIFWCLVHAHPSVHTHPVSQ